MPLQKIVFRPGIVKEATNYANEGGWFDGDKVRFRAGMPESLGGWKKVVEDRFQGTCRTLHEWMALDGNRFLGVGTHLKYYIFWGGQYYDITPVRLLHELPADPFTTSAGNTLIVNDPGHSAAANDFVRFIDALGFTPPPNGMITADVLNREYQIAEIIDAGSYRIQLPVTGTSAAPPQSGGGAAAKAEYQIATGLDVAVPGTGWGASPWGGIVPGGGTANDIGWGMPYSVVEVEGLVPYNQIRLWSEDNWGEDLVLCVRNGAIYFWERALGVSKRAVELASRAGAGPSEGDAPVKATVVLVSEGDRHMIAAGVNDHGQTLLDPLLVRWSDQENALVWKPARNNTAGGQRLSSGSAIVTALRTRQETLIWTDKNLHSMRFVGLPYVFSFNLLAESVSIISPNAAVNAGGKVWWMDRNAFYVYTGQVQELPSTVRDYVFSDFNWPQALKVYGGHNRTFQEVMWFYPSAGSSEIDRYVLYNYVDGVWSIGNLERTAWLEVALGTYPLATSQGLLYYHEYGHDADSEPLGAWIESSDMDLEDGGRFVFIRRLIPDVHFRGKGELQTLGIKLRTRRAPGDFYSIADMAEVTPATRYCWIRARGRQFSLRVESNSMGTGWRLGAMRVEMQPDGRR